MWTFQRAPDESADGARTNAARGQRRGFCPSVWTPMASGDGLIVRLSARAAGLRAGELRALAGLARSHGNGLLEITRRGKLQLRGIRENSLAPLQAELAALGLAGSSALTVNPLAGLHPDCAVLDAPARELERALTASGVRAKLSDKFGVVLDSGAVLGDIEADIRVELEVVAPRRVRIAVANEPLAMCDTARCAEAVVALAEALAASGFERMRELVRAEGTTALRARIEELAFAAAISSEPGSASRPICRTSRSSHIGFHASPTPWLGLGVAFGSGELPQWLAVATLAERFGTGEIRITPFRSVILPVVAADPSPEIELLAREAGLIVDPADPLLRAVACPGAPACASAHGPTRPLARRLARELLPLLAPDARLHVSGCSKRCADRRPATVTLVHDPAGSQLDLDLASGV